MEWAAALPYSNGQVGMYGGSYVGATQMLAASSAPPHLVAIFPYVTASEYYEGWTYEGGALMQWFTESWTTGLAVDTVTRKTASLGRPRPWSEQLPVDEYRLAALPTPDEAAPYFRDWVRHESDDDYWAAIRVSDRYARMNVKALHAGGWHDIFSGGSIRCRAWAEAQQPERWSAAYGVAAQVEGRKRPLRPGAAYRKERCNANDYSAASGSEGIDAGICHEGFLPSRLSKMRLALRNPSAFSTTHTQTGGIRINSPIPSGVSSYSTRGGISPNSRRISRPSRSMERSVFVNIR